MGADKTGAIEPPELGASDGHYRMIRNVSVTLLPMQGVYLLALVGNWLLVT